jgi:hypothetical protein
MDKQIDISISPKISVFVILHKSGEFLRSCLKSLTQQTLQTDYFEIIFVGNDLEKNAQNLVNEFIKKRKNSKLIKYSELIGKNESLKIAKGEYIYFLDGWDYLDVTTLESLVMKAYDNSSDIVTSGVCQIDYENNVLERRGYESIIKADKPKLLTDIYSSKLNSPVNGFLIKRSFLKDLHIVFGKSINCDFLFTLKSFYYAKNVEYIYDCLYFSRTRDQFSSINYEYIDNFIDSMLSCYQFILKETSIGFFRKIYNKLLDGNLINISTLLFAIYKSGNDDISVRSDNYWYLYNKIKTNDILRDSFSNSLSIHTIAEKFMEIFDDNTNTLSAVKMFENLFEDGVEEDLIINNESSENIVLQESFKFKLRDFINRIRNYNGSCVDKIKYLLYRLFHFMCKVLSRTQEKQMEDNSIDDEVISSEIIFFCEADYHLRNAVSVVRILEEKGYKVSIVDFTKFLSAGKRQLEKPEIYKFEDIDIESFNKKTYEKIDRKNLKATIFFNDWDTNNSFIRELRHEGILTIGIDEGVNDFLKLGEGFTSKISPYRTVEHVFLPGEFETQFFKDRPGQHHIVGLPMIRKLYKEEVSFPKKTLAVINVNFTYGVLTQYRDLFVKTAVEGCKLAGIDYVLTQHPMDNADLSEYNVTDKNMYDTIRDGSIFISRFSGAIIEALAMGKPCVYHNPHNEKILKFQEPMGAYSISDSAESLAKAIKYELDRSSKTLVREYSRKFMEYHANIGEKKEPAELITETIIKLMKS